ncbi:hypothetical protein L198_06568 [Cryptococcus wingfieldii CBS 7118]|uniref:Uncharacterized protein n=1 Tax=Cryptococcus wingfieldii CBS 7118 TaxID=1295528 RepID=A0A1E3ILE5_9TREE|nr:hypothetical protein L198_06568 [Cryptococcus wingfieldii CBS 7118]ODN88766.1 hypothetical protein L198_06568 [Cryptococcus wingfieldii CBS 7118]
MLRSRQAKPFSQADQGLNLTATFPSEIYFLDTCSPLVYKHVTLNEGNADNFFLGLADGKMKKGEMQQVPDKRVLGDITWLG